MAFDEGPSRWEALLSGMVLLSLHRFTGSFVVSMHDGVIRRGTLRRLTELTTPLRAEPNEEELVCPP